ncbi:MAG: lipoyl domain-containing protein [Dysosmobacter welbionis]
MPRQGQSVESCVITSWAKKVGDPVHTGETLFSYETDKAAFDEEAKVDGTLLAVFYQEQDDVPCLSEVAVIGTPERISPLSVLMQMCRPLRRKRRRQLLPRWQPRAVAVQLTAPTAAAGVSPRARVAAERLHVD